MQNEVPSTLNPNLYCVGVWVRSVLGTEVWGLRVCGVRGGTSKRGFSQTDRRA